MIEIGSVIDNKYKILAVIGHGGMSTVYLAMNERANKQWAIKEIRKDKTSDAVRKSIENEISIMRKLDHPYLPSIIDVIDYMDSFLIVMDYVQGNTLLQLLREYGKASIDDVVDWCAQLCDVLGYLHSRKPAVIYRDIKPGNVMLRPDGTIALIDFGIAREYKYENYEDTTCLGTYGYAAPEQFGGLGQTDGRTDIYSLGMTAWHLLTGINPCESVCDISDIRKVRPDVTEGMAKILIKCTQKNPNDRYNNCEELLYDLNNYDKLDHKYKRNQIIKLVVIAISACISISALICAGVMKSKLQNLTVTTYQDMIEKGSESDVIEEKIDMYDTAIKVDPTDESAYLELLGGVYLRDDIFTASEAEELRTILISTVNGDTCSNQLKSNPEGYARFAYELGIAYFYCYEDQGNRNLASKWLKDASESDYLSDKQKKRAEILYKLSEISNIGTTDRTGDSKYSYAEYWGDLSYLVQGDIANEDNTTTALIVYRDFLGQVMTNAKKFQVAGVTREQMEADLDIVEAAIESIGLVVDESDERVYELYTDCLEDIEVTKQAVENAYK